MPTRGSCRTAIVAVALAALGAGCTPSPGAGPSSPAAGCHDNLSGPTALDRSFTGEPADIGNLRTWTSTDGTCSGRLIDTTDVDSTVIVASRRVDAEHLCTAFFGLSQAQSFDAATGPWQPPFGPNAYRCAASA